METKTILYEEDPEIQSDINFVYYHRDKFLDVYCGQSEFKVFTKSERGRAIKQGLFTKNHYPNSQRLTIKAIEILKQTNLVSET